MNIPSNPGAIYIKSGWMGYGHWLGTGNIRTRDIKFVSFEVAKKMIQKLKLQTREEYLKWWRNKGKLITPPIPAKPFKSYSNSGWKGWLDFLGKK